MDTKHYEDQIKRVRALLRKHRSLWYQMDRAGAASYRYLVKLDAGEIENPGVHKLAAIEEYLTAKTPSAAAS